MTTLDDPGPLLSSTIPWAYSAGMSRELESKVGEGLDAVAWSIFRFASPAGSSCVTN